MELKFKASVMKVGNGRVVTIPKVICDNFNIQKGDIVDLIVDDNGIHISLTGKAHKTAMKEKAKYR